MQVIILVVNFLFVGEVFSEERQLVVKPYSHYYDNYIPSHMLFFSTTCRSKAVTEAQRKAFVPRVYNKLISSS